MGRTNLWQIPGRQPRVVLDHTLSGGAYATHAPVIVDDHRVAIMTRLGGPKLVLLDRTGRDDAAHEIRVSLGGDNFDPGPIAIDDGIVLASWNPRHGREIFTCRVDALGHRWSDDSFVRLHLPGVGFSPDEATVESIAALPREGTLVSWFEDDEPYGVGLSVRRAHGAVWSEEGSADAIVDDVVVGHLVVRLDVIAPQRPIIARGIDTGEQLWARAPRDHEHERIFEAFGAVLLVNDSRRANAEMPSAGFRLTTPPSEVSLVDARTGDVRWNRTFGGYITSLIESSVPRVSDREMAMIVTRHDGRGAFVRIDARGNTRQDRHEITGAPTTSRYAPPRAESWPALVAYDGRRVLTWQAPHLRAYDANDFSRPHWSCELSGEASSVAFTSSPTMFVMRTATRVIGLME